MVSPTEVRWGDLEAMSQSFKLTLNGRTYDVEVGDLSQNPVTVVVDGWEHKVTVPEFPAASNAPRPAVRRRAEERVRVPAQPASVAASPTAAAGDDSVLRAPMPGRIVKVNVGVGDGVSQGQALVVLESMKMENTLSSNVSGVVSAVHVSEDDSVQQGQTLVEFE